jgi:hypothetical protein
MQSYYNTGPEAIIKHVSMKLINAVNINKWNNLSHLDSLNTKGGPKYDVRNQSPGLGQA